MRKIIFVTLLLIVATASTAFSITKDEIVANLQKKYDKVEDYSADFIQKTEMVSVSRVKRAKGTVYFKKNGRMNWEYTQPVKQNVISNGKKMWIYQPELNQVQEFDYAGLDMSKTANSFLNGIGRLKDDFEISFSDEVASEYYVLELVPKEDTLGFEMMKVYIMNMAFIISKTVTYDEYENTNTIVFKNIKFNTGVADDFFDFKVPEGVHVVTPPSMEK